MDETARSSVTEPASSPQSGYVDPPDIAFTVGGRRQEAGGHWFRGEHCNFNPARANMRAPDAIERFILEGWLPSRPLITPETQVTTFGSCFARHIGEYLDRRRYKILTRESSNAHVVTIGEGMVNSYAIRQQFDWAFRGIAPQTPVWHGYSAEQFGFDEEIRRSTLELFAKTDVFILTFGLSEVWYDEPTGEVFWRAVPADVYDPARHKFRITTVAENAENIRAIYETIREFRPDASIVFTLSPIPLVATFRPESCIAANSVSKAILRAAIDEVYRDVAAEGRLHYWPSYEIVMEGFEGSVFGADRRHVHPDVLDYIMLLFETHYCTGLEPPRTLASARLDAIAASGTLPRSAAAALRSGDLAAIRSFVAERIASDDPETAELVGEYLQAMRPEDSEVAELVRRAREGKRRDINPAGGAERLVKQLRHRAARAKRALRR